MKKIARRAKAAYILLIAFLLGLGIFYANLALKGGIWALSPYNRHIYSDGLLQNSGTILDRNGEILAQTKNNKREYSKDYVVRKSMLHIIGDNSGHFSSIQTNYDDVLAGYTFMGGIYELAEHNAVPKMTLTVSAKLNKKLYNAFGGKKGAVIAYNYKTGEIVASLSAPNYDPYNIPSNLDNKKYEGIYVNRALNGMYPPGSTFKIITALSALENITGIESKKFTCNGKQKNEDNGEIICNGKHGEITLEQGLKVSCNIVFANLANELGAEKLQKTAEKFGFNGNFNVGEITCNGGYYDAKGANVTDLGWSGVGQHTVLSSPITLMKLSGTIANNGNEIAPRLIKSIKNSIGLPTTINISLPTNRIDSEHAKKLNLMLEQAAKYSFGNELANKYSLRAKTGTAEVEKGAPHSWVTGFLANNKTPYAFAIIIENGGGAASSTRYVLNVLLKGLTEIK